MTDCPVPSRRPLSGEPASLRVFIVEDHDDARQLLCMLVERMGHTVISAARMDDALARLPGADCDVLISDIELPDGDGWELLRQLRTARPLYAVALSGRDLPGDRSRSLGAGYRQHLVKPAGPIEIRRVLDDAAAWIGCRFESTAAL